MSARHVNFPFIMLICKLGAFTLQVVRVRDSLRLVGGRTWRVGFLMKEKMKKTDGEEDEED